MNKTHLLAAIAALLMAPFAFAHSDGGVAGTPKLYCEITKAEQQTHEYAGTGIGFVTPLPADGSIPPCPYGDVPWDGHYEWAAGGAVLVVKNDERALVCGWPPGDHVAFPTVWALDAAITPVPFGVHADTLNNVPPLDPNEPNCGDFESDIGIECADHCVALFPPGLDGTYRVYVFGTLGHVWTSWS